MVFVKEWKRMRLGHYGFPESVDLRTVKVINAVISNFMSALLFFLWLSRYRRGGTGRTGLALNKAWKAFFAKSGRRKACIVMTAGRSADNVYTRARYLRRRGVQLVALGLGRRYNMHQLKLIASKNKNRYQLFTAHFKTLGNLLPEIKRKICKGMQFASKNFFVTSNEKKNLCNL